jgi:hypothetical protein
VALEHMCVAAERQLIAERMLARAEAAGNQRGMERARMSIDTAQRQHRSGHSDAREAEACMERLRSTLAN